MKTICLIGGTGTISLEVTRLLLHQGWQVTLLNRGNRPLPPGAQSIVGDIHNPQDIREKLQGRYFDVVANFIAFTPQEIERDYGLFHNACGQYIFISSASAYQKLPTGWYITESTPLKNPHWQYSRDKIACEEKLMEYHRSQNFPVTIIRPSHTYSNQKIPLGFYGKTSWQIVRRMQAGKPVLIHGDGTALWTFTHARDFAKGFAGLAGNAHALGHSVHITSDEALSWNQAYHIIARTVGCKLHPLHVPTSLLVTAGKTAGYDFEGSLWGDKSHCAVFDNTKLKSLVPGFAATTRYDQGIREAVDHILAHPELQGEDPDFDAFCDKIVDKMQKITSELI